VGWRQNVGIGYSDREADVCLDTDLRKLGYCQSLRPQHGSVRDIPYPSRTFWLWRSI
jgi:hypothetical protein